MLELWKGFDDSYWEPPQGLSPAGLCYHKKGNGYWRNIITKRPSLRSYKTKEQY